MSREHLTYAIRLPLLAAANVIGPAGSQPRLIRFGDGPAAVALLASPDMPVRVLRDGKAEPLALIAKARP